MGPKNPGRFTILEHPSDIGVLAVAGSRKQALEAAAEGLVSIIADPRSIHPKLTRPLEARGQDEATLPILWLNEIIFYFDAEQLLFSRFSVDHWSRTALLGRGWGERFDPNIHELRTAVKAVTYHQYRSRQRPEGWELQVFFDV